MDVSLPRRLGMRCNLPEQDMRRVAWRPATQLWQENSLTVTATPSKDSSKTEHLRPPCKIPILFASSRTPPCPSMRFARTKPKQRNFPWQTKLPEWMRHEPIKRRRSGSTKLMRAMLNKRTWPTKTPLCVRADLTKRQECRPSNITLVSGRQLMWRTKTPLSAQRRRTN